jgi:hypothetical protein
MLARRTLQSLSLTCRIAIRRLDARGQAIPLFQDHLGLGVRQLRLQGQGLAVRQEPDGIVGGAVDFPPFFPVGTGLPCVKPAFLDTWGEMQPYQRITRNLLERFLKGKNECTMNTAFSFLGRWALIALSISGLSLLAAGEAVGRKPRKRHKKTVAEMVEAIASPNKPPKLVNGKGPGSPKMHQFPKSYNWKKQKKVYKALVKVYKDTSVEMWEELIRKTSDGRYSLTVTDQSSESSYNQTVGDVCSDLAYTRLIGVFHRRLPYGEGRPDASPRIHLDIGIEDLSKWRNERKNKCFYQLQIEVCKRALKELEKEKDVSQAKKNKARKKINFEIKRLRRTKQPVVFKSNPFSELWAPYTDGYAK